MQLAVLITVGALASQETYPRNSAVCDHDDDKEALECRKRLSGGYECHNPAACTDIHCSDWDVARRAGMICDKFPSYNGGYPMQTSIHWDDEHESYNCLVPSPNHTYCHRWDTIEESPGEYELGSCTCQEGDTVCRRWTCEQRETKKCGDGCRGVPDNWFPTECICTHCDNDDDHHDRHCRDTTHTPETEWEYTDGICVEDDGTQCTRWYQEEYDEQNVHFREYENYTRVSPIAWLGNINSEEEFEFSECSCTNVTVQGWCYNWRCYEKGQDYFFPNLCWSILTVFVGLIIGFVSIIMVPDRCDNTARYAIGGVAAGHVFNLLGIWLGGVMVLIIYTVIATLFMGALFPTEPRDSYPVSSSSHNNSHRAVQI